MEQFLNYYSTGGVAILETAMIFFLIIYLMWNVKLFMEGEDDE